MPQSTSAPSHTAVIMDGNGRWATMRGLPRYAGHREGSSALRRVVEAAPALGIKLLTLYAFSSDNWNRPRQEVDALMELLAWHLREESIRCVEQGVQMQMIGRRDRLPGTVIEAAETAERITVNGARLSLRLAVDYSARESISRAAVGEDVDLLIRTGGEQRLSDFLLWECAYAELYFTACLWPDFGAPELQAAVTNYQSRERRYGRISLGRPLGQLEATNGQRTLSEFRGDRWLR